MSWVTWDPAAPGDWFQAIDGSDAVIHLAGEPAVGVRWTETVKRRLLESRVVPAGLLVDAIEAASRPPSALISASGVSYYGDTAERCDEQSPPGPPGADFLTEVTLAWEAAAMRAEPLGARVVCARLGIVLGPGGGALSVMTKPFQWFVGGPLGSGEQWVSWIHLEDAVSILLACLDDATLSGPVNVTAPGPVPQRELAKALGRALQRPSALKVPSFALRLRLGQGATPILTGQPVIPRVMQEHGYTWQHPTLEGALSAALNR